MTWKQQLANSITTPEQLAGHFDIDPEPMRAVAARYPLLITPHYFNLIEKPGDPIWRQCPIGLMGHVFRVGVGIPASQFRWMDQETLFQKG